MKLCFQHRTVHHGSLDALVKYMVGVNLCLIAAIRNFITNRPVLLNRDFHIQIPNYYVDM